MKLMEKKERHRSIDKTWCLFLAKVELHKVSLFVESFFLENNRGLGFF